MVHRSFVVCSFIDAKRGSYEECMLPKWPASDTDGDAGHGDMAASRFSPDGRIPMRCLMEVEFTNPRSAIPQCILTLCIARLPKSERVALDPLTAGQQGFRYSLAVAVCNL